MSQTRFTRRDFLRVAAAAAVSPALLAACAPGEKERVVNFFNWSNYIGKETLPRFTSETGIKVNYDVFADEEEMFAKLRSGVRGYDLIVGTDYMIPRFRALNIVDPFPPGALPNLANISAQFRHPSYDPELSFTVPYLWGTTGIGFNKSKVHKTPSSWMDLFDERYKGRISMLDNSRDCLSFALLVNGHPEDSADPAHLEAAKQLLIRQRPLLKSYSSSTYMDGLVSGELVMAMAWSGDLLQAAKDNPQLDYVIPKEGSYMWVDSLCLVRGAPHREDALRLVDYLLKGEVAAEVANHVRYASPNEAAKKHLEKAILKDQRVYPTDLNMKRLKFHAILDPELSQLWNQAWTDVKVL